VQNLFKYRRRRMIEEGQQNSWNTIMKDKNICDKIYPLYYKYVGLELLLKLNSNAPLLHRINTIIFTDIENLHFYREFISIEHD
jgi:hypothetical protein